MQDCFSNNQSHAAFVMQAGVPLRSLPNRNNSPHANLVFGERVCTLAHQIEEGLSWAFVQSYSYNGKTREPIRGWLPESTLDYWLEFRPFSSVRPQEVPVEGVNFVGSYTVSKGGAFTLPADEGEYSCREHPGHCKARLVRGQLFIKGDLVVAVTRNAEFTDLFLQSSTGELCPIGFWHLPPNPSVKGTSCAKAQATPYVER
jgi:hypothetical protein